MLMIFMAMHSMYYCDTITHANKTHVSYFSVNLVLAAAQSSSKYGCNNTSNYRCIAIVGSAIVLCR